MNGWDATIVVFAHAGHVLIDLPIFMGPVLAIGAWLMIASWRDRRSAAREGSSARKRRPRNEGPGNSGGTH